MFTLDKIKSDLEEVESLEVLAEVFTDIAHARLLRVRAGIERNRLFAGEVSRVLHVVRVTAEEHKLSALRKKKISASVVITSNKRLYYGGLDTKVMNYYMAHTAYTGYVDRFVIGSVGVDTLKTLNYPFQFEIVDFEKDLPSIAELTNLANKLKDYQKVFVYYPQFQTVLSQQPSFVDITGLVSAVASGDVDRYYIFEPEIEKILDFFESQVMAILLQQAFLESELARIGSQLMTMDNAQGNAMAMIKQENSLLASAKRQMASMKVLEMVAGLKRNSQFTI